MSSTFNKIASIVMTVAAVVVLSGFAVSAPVAKADQISDIIAQIAALQAQIAALQGNSGSSAACSFTRSLTVGSQGTDVTCLQNYLMSHGQSIPAGATGYFGSQTRAAVAGWQAANGVAPAVGYFGPLSQAKYSSLTAGTTPTPVPPGSPVPPGQITTPGQPGTIVAELNPTPSSGLTIRAGETDVALLGIKFRASGPSDLLINRIRVNLGTSLAVVTKVFQNLYLVDDAGNKLISLVPASASVYEEGTTKFVLFNNVNFLIPHGSIKVLTVKGDLFSSISTANQISWTETIPVSGIVATDGTNINQFVPSTLFSNSATVGASLADSAVLTVSLASDSPLASQVVAVDGSSRDEINSLDLMHMNLRATGDSVKIRTIIANIYASGSGTASAPTAYLYDGANQISSATITSSVATFSNLDFVIPQDTTKTYSIKVRVTGAISTATTGFMASTTGATSITAENHEGTAVVPSGNASSTQTMSVIDKGLAISIVNKSISTNGVPQSSTANTFSTSTLSAIFTVRLQARDASVLLGTLASSTPAFGTTTTSFNPYKNGVLYTAMNAGTSTSWAVPSGYNSTSNTFTLNDGDTVDVPITYTILGRNMAPWGDGLATTTSTYASQGSSFGIQFSSVRWTLSGTGSTAFTSNFMDTQTAWRTSDVTFP